MAQGGTSDWGNSAPDPAQPATDSDNRQNQEWGESTGTAQPTTG
jgi:hypothetical protein